MLVIEVKLCGNNMDLTTTLNVGRLKADKALTDRKCNMELSIIDVAVEAHSISESTKKDNKEPSLNALMTGPLKGLRSAGQALDSRKNLTTLTAVHKSYCNEETHGLIGKVAAMTNKKFLTDSPDKLFQFASMAPCKEQSFFKGMLISLVVAIKRGDVKRSMEVSMAAIKFKIDTRVRALVEHWVTESL